MSVPIGLRCQIRDRLWAEADRLNWSSLSTSDKSRYYTIWTETEDLGGVLGRYMDPRQVRVYIKDTLLKPYTREISANPDKIFRVLGIPDTEKAVATFIKPHGLLLSDGRHVAWSKASAWKATLLALHERAFEGGTPYAVVLTHAATKFALLSQRAVVENAAYKLEIEHLVWLD
ncbi:MULTISPECIES: hypothetical protein [Alphaproteobacteria]|uniref:hypothetical protein n=1 Tax=Alphaproteobacteria TaxID=28211 RepID=UPI0040336446